MRGCKRGWRPMGREEVGDGMGGAGRRWEMRWAGRGGGGRQGKRLGGIRGEARSADAQLQGCARVPRRHNPEALPRAQTAHIP